MMTANSYTNEPQTAEYQAAVDNVWFENIRNASSIQASWNWARKDYSRVDYVSDLEEKIILATRSHRAVDNTRN